jgi:hypothetical protein
VAQTLPLILLDVNPEKELLILTVTVVFNFLQYHFLPWLHHFTSLATMHKGPNFCTSWPVLVTF